MDAEQLATRSVPPPPMSLLGLVPHMAEVERHWFRRVLAGEDAPHRYGLPGEDGAFSGAVGDREVVAEAWAVWREEVANAESFVERTDDMGFLGR